MCESCRGVLERSGQEDITEELIDGLHESIKEEFDA